MTMKKIEINEYIVADPNICHGKPTFKGTRIMVWQVLEMLKAGMAEEEIMKAFPTRLTRKQIRAALDYAASLTKGENYVLLKIEIPTR
jgi:uncharacterized protein (DUF433 family)